MAKIIVFGGSFDPVHNAHIEMAELVNISFAPSKIIFVPAFLAPHKMCHFAPAADRVEMLKIALKNIPNVEINLYEMKQETKIYSYQTLDYFKSCYPKDEILMIIGSDALLSLSTWKNIDYIVKNYRFVVAKRKDVVITPQTKFLDRCLFIDKEIDNVSSTQIRNLVRSKKFLSNYLNKEVYNYIINHGLYSSENNNP
ncbi:MAG: nicotinate (nicotinamide) nucleotide adenylyltransferase [Elusimicrobiota bacterium]|jgi:nicotinate-nucleotide adenylyltransferase|nr:nicotinate (nicotinamide) nucleotide adenylyltransferase [Elusimicrobiota bacterium]